MDAGRNAPARVRLKPKTEFRQVAHAHATSIVLVGSALNLNLIPAIDMLLENDHVHFLGLGVRGLGLGSIGFSMGVIGVWGWVVLFSVGLGYGSS